ncbi:MAG: methyltransferase [Pseudomonadota bacterium]
MQEHAETVDGLFRNKVRVIQASKGYRVSEDALILTWFAKPGADDLVLDAGAGCGVIAFGLAIKNPSVYLVGLEIQDGLAGRAQRGVELNGLGARVSVVQGDLRIADAFFRRDMFDMVVSNPPYYQSGSGRVSILSEKALSRHQIMMPLMDLFMVSSRLLKSTGKLCLIYPAKGIHQLDTAAEVSCMNIKRKMWIRTQESAEPVLICLEVLKAHSDQDIVEETICLYGANGTRTLQAEAILAGEDYSV